MKYRVEQYQIYQDTPVYVVEKNNEKDAYRLCKFLNENDLTHNTFAKVVKVNNATLALQPNSSLA